jgi:hypothetical protein
MLLDPRGGGGLPLEVVAGGGGDGSKGINSNFAQNGTSFLRSCAEDAPLH